MLIQETMGAHGGPAGASAASSSNALPYPPLPASPTLTNPDMILPDYDDADLASSPDRSQSPLMMWKNAHHQLGVIGGALPDMQFHLPTSLSGSYVLPTGPITPTTPIIYGNGTMLSDIGEVTEVESVVHGQDDDDDTDDGGRSPLPRSKIGLGTSLAASKLNGSIGLGSAAGANTGLAGGRDSDDDTGFRSSPTMGYQPGGLGHAPRRHQQQQASQPLPQTPQQPPPMPTLERRASIESTSTIRTQDHAGLFADFDDAVSIDDSNFQGDDEESVADSYADDVSVVRDHHGAGAIALPGPPMVDGRGEMPLGDARYSTTSISRRAEQILANAKRRLTTMEGNLSRARSSLYISTTGSIGSSSTPSPPIVRASTSLRETAPYGHHRVLSSDSSNAENIKTLQPRRSASALGAAGGYRKPLSGSKSVNALNGEYSRSLAKPDINLEPLSEDEPSHDPHSNRDSAQSDNLLSPTFGGPLDKNLVRSASVAQMRDLNDKVKDLKGKISTLREQARADSMKRRSLQSLRTPSPFTHAQVDQWYAEPAKAKEPESADGAARNPWNGEESSVDGDIAASGVNGKVAAAPDVDEESVTSARENPKLSVDVPGDVEIEIERPLRTPEDEGFADVIDEDDFDDMRTEDGFQDQDQGPAPDPDLNQEGVIVPENGYESESGESLYHDAFQAPLSHEDREDAFDYEHFFLHSAMGTISQQRLARQARRDSYSSEDSVETTRGPTTQPTNGTGSGSGSGSDEIRPRHHQRRGSGDTTSTMESFATANEGRASRTETEDEGNSGDLRSPRIQSATVSLNGDGPKSPVTARRTNFPPIQEESTPEGTPVRHERHNSVIHRPIGSAGASMHRPSVSSFESTGTNRSFPLISSKAKLVGAGGVPTPQGSPDQALKHISDSLLSETASVMELESAGADRDAVASRASTHNAAATMQMLAGEDQAMVEKLVASLGRCVLGLSDAGNQSAEARLYRQRIEAARRLLEGLEEA